MPLSIARTAAFVAAVTASVLVLAGCSATASGVERQDARPNDLKIVATTTQVADFTRHIVGDTPETQVTQLIQPNQSAHTYDPSAADLTILAKADVLIINGVGLESWLDDAIDASGFSGTTIDAAHGIAILHADETDDEGVAPAEEGHDHSAGNPHIWTDVRNAEAMTRTIADGLAAASTKRADAFEANAAAYTGRLAELDAWIRANVDTVPAGSRMLVANHDALGYFTAAYGITYVGSIVPSFDDNAEPSAAQIDHLVRAIKKFDVRAVFSEASVSPKAAKAIASEARVAVYSGQGALYVDSLGPAGSAGATYISAQLHNIKLILRSWGVSATAIPADLAEAS